MITTMAIRRPEQADGQTGGTGLTVVPRNPGAVLLARQSPSLGYQLSSGSFLRRAGAREACDWVSFGLLGRDTVGRATQ